MLVGTSRGVSGSIPSVAAMEGEPGRSLALFRKQMARLACGLRMIRLPLRRVIREWSRAPLLPGAHPACGVRLTRSPPVLRQFCRRPRQGAPRSGSGFVIVSLAMSDEERTTPRPAPIRPSVRWSIARTWTNRSKMLSSTVGLRKQALRKEEKQERLKWKDTAEMEAYKALSALHNVQETIFWTRNNILALIQTAMVAALFAVLGPKEGCLTAEWAASRRIPATFVCIAGWFIACIWLQVVDRTNYLFSATLRILSEMERKFGVPVEFRAVGLFRGATRNEPDDETMTVLTRIECVPSATESERLSEIWKKLGRFFAAFWITALVVVWICYALAPSTAAK